LAVSIAEEANGISDLSLSSVSSVAVQALFGCGYAALWQVRYSLVAAPPRCASVVISSCVC